MSRSPASKRFNTAGHNGISQLSSWGLVALPMRRHTMTDDGRSCAAETALHEVFILGDDHRVLIECVLPDDSVFGFSESDFPDGHGITPVLPQSGGESGWQLGVDQKLHAAVCSTA